MGTKNNPGEFDCYAAAEPDEPMFVLLARDPLAPELVRNWAYQRTMKLTEGGQKILTLKQALKIHEALTCADNIEAWNKENRDDS